MRDIPWKLFTLTGDIETYMLYREHQDLYGGESDGSEDEFEENVQQ